MLTKQLATKGSEADSLSRRVGAVNSLTIAFEQVRMMLRCACADIASSRCGTVS